MPSTEIRLFNVNFGVTPTEDGGKQLELLTPDGQTVYVIPFGIDGMKLLLKLWRMPNDKLAAHNEAQRAKAPPPAEGEPRLS